jgi:hypothetical protein
LLPSVSRLSRQCGMLNISQPYRSPRPFTGIDLLSSFTCTLQSIHVHGHTDGQSHKFAKRSERDQQRTSSDNVTAMPSVGVHFRMWHTAVRVLPMQINCWQLIKRWDVEQGRHGQSAKQRRNIAPFTVGLDSLVAPLLLAEGSMTNVLDNGSV